MSVPDMPYHVSTGHAVSRRRGMGGQCKLQRHTLSQYRTSRIKSYGDRGRGRKSSMGIHYVSTGHGESGRRGIGGQYKLHREASVSYTHLTLPTICSV
eukprot:908924-Rhodomonas_salina.2